MPPVMITLPAGDDELQKKVETFLKQYSRIVEPPRSYGPEDIKLLFEVVTTGATAVGGMAWAGVAWFKFVQEFRKTFGGKGIKLQKPGQNAVELNDVDEAKVKELGPGVE